MLLLATNLQRNYILHFTMLPTHPNDVYCIYSVFLSKCGIKFVVESVYEMNSQCPIISALVHVNAMS